MTRFICTRSSVLASRWFCIYACKLFERIPNRLQEVEKMSHVLSYHR